jgi:hypothetical protein
MRYAKQRQYRVRARADRRIARLVGNQGGLAENVARVELRDPLTAALYLRLALDDKIDFVAKISIGENCFPASKCSRCTASS